MTAREKCFLKSPWLFNRQPVTSQNVLSDRQSGSYEFKFNLKNKPTSNRHIHNNDFFVKGYRRVKSRKKKEFKTHKKHEVPLRLELVTKNEKAI